MYNCNMLFDQTAIYLSDIDISGAVHEIQSIYKSSAPEKCGNIEIKEAARSSMLTCCKEDMKDDNNIHMLLK